MEFTVLAKRCESMPYCAALGVQVDAIEAERVRLRLPFKDENSNPGRALHGGVLASLIDVAGTAAAWTGIDERPGIETSTLDLSVNYLAAAIGEDIVATAQVLRRGKEIVYSEVDVRNDAGKRIAVGLLTYRAFDAAANPAAADRQRSATAAGGAAGEKIRNADLFVRAPFISRLGVTVEAAHGGESLLAMPARADLADAAGAMHEGALAAMIDTTGALASWSLTGLDMRFKASTVGIHVNYHAPATEDVVAHARTLRRNNEIFLNQVAVTRRTSGDVVAAGTVTYRIVVD
jgi:uncharacterized protein (TIGR00369 family)